MFRNLNSKRLAWIILAIVVVGAVVLISQSPVQTYLNHLAAQPVISEPVGDLPVMKVKPVPTSMGWEDCPPEGSGGDVDFNLRLNRVDTAEYTPVALDTIMKLRWPRDTELMPMKAWSDPSRSYIERFMGLPISVEGYLISVRETQPGTADCGQAHGSRATWRLAIGDDPGSNEAQALVTLSTPQTRAEHKWTLEHLRNTVKAGQRKVRVSGWLLFDASRAKDIGFSRATLWELAPVMRIEVWQGGRWRGLDDLVP